MRSHISRFLLCLSLIFCVGFGSNITVHAAFNDTVFITPSDRANLYFDSTVYNGAIAMKSKGTTQHNAAFELIISPPLDFINETGFFYISFIKPEAYNPDILFFNSDGSDTPGILFDYYRIDNSMGTDVFVYKLPSDLSYIQIGRNPGSTGSGSIVQNKTMFFSIIFIPDSQQATTNDIIAAIHNQTSDILSKLDSQTDEITGAIEDQYSGDPEQSFGVDDIITQHNEKMGVLSFSSDVMMDVLGLFSPNQTLSSELVFPSMSLTIAGQRNKVQLWPEYRFDLDELRQHWPTFINLMRTVTVASVWLLVLRYCYKVFEKYFLAGGSS